MCSEWIRKSGCGQNLNSQDNIFWVCKNQISYILDTSLIVCWTAVKQYSDTSVNEPVPILANNSHMQTKILFLHASGHQRQNTEPLLSEEFNHINHTFSFSKSGRGVCV